MSNDATHTPSREARTARLAVSLFFFTNAVIFSSLVPHFPGIKAELGLSNAHYGLSIAAVPTGAITAGLLAGFLVRKFGSAKTSLIFTVLAALVLVMIPSASGVGLLVAFFFLIGASDSIADVGQNAHGLKVQRAYGRSILNSFHAIWSIGAATGAALGALAISIGLSRQVHLTIIAALVVAGAYVAYTKRLRGADQISDEHDSSADKVAVPALHLKPGVPVTGGRIFFLLAALSLLAIAGALVEDSGSTWAAIYLNDSLSTTASIASLGFIALVGAQFVGRIVGDGLVDRFGQRTIATAGGLLIAGGMGLALAFPSVPLTIIGFAAAGFGSATLVPAAYQGADEIPGLKPGTGLTIVSWLLRVGFLISPPIVGLIADNSSLRLGLLVLPITGALVVVCAQVLSSQRARRFN